MSQCVHRAHSILVSVCEWTELVFVASRYLKLSGKENIHVRKFHAWHSLQWALNDFAAFSLDRVRSLWSLKEISNDAYAYVLATRIEGEVKIDVQLELLTELATKVLGRIGYDLSSNGNEPSCNRGTCRECKRLNANLSILHRDLDQKKKEGKWWGFKSVEVWERILFTNPFLRRKRPLIYDTVSARQGILVICDAVSKRPPLCETLDAALPGDKKFHGIDHVFNQEEIHTRWIDEPDHLDDSDDEVDDTYDSNNMISTSVTKIRTLQDIMDEKSSNICAMPELEISKLPVRILTLKIVVAAHLFGVDHGFVCLGVYSLAQACHLGDSRGEEFFALVWLSQCFGFNIQAIVYGVMEERAIANISSERIENPKKYTFLAID